VCHHCLDVVVVSAVGGAGVGRLSVGGGAVAGCCCWFGGDL